MKKMNKNRLTFLKRAYEVAVNAPTITRQEIVSLVNEGFKWPNWLMNDKSFRVDRGTYQLPEIAEDNSSIDSQ